MSIVRSDNAGRGYIAREGDTGSVIWQSHRDTRTVGKTGRVVVPARPGQLVFSDGASVLSPGESLYPQDAASICTGDVGAAANYAGRYLVKWPLQLNLLASAGFDPVTLISSTPANHQFTTIGGKQCITSLGGSGVKATTISWTPTAQWRSRSYTITGMGYMPTGSGATVLNFRLVNGSSEVRVSPSGTDAVVNGTTRASVFDGWQYDTWVHYAMTFDGLTNQTVLYLNGVQRSSGTSPNVCTTTSGASFGLSTDVGNNRLNAFRNLRFYSVALTSSQIAAIAAEDAA